MLPPASMWLNLVEVDVQASKMLGQTYQPTAQKTRTLPFKQHLPSKPENL